MNTTAHDPNSKRKLRYKRAQRGRKMRWPRGTPIFFFFLALLFHGQDASLAFFSFFWYPLFRHRKKTHSSGPRRAGATGRASSRGPCPLSRLRGRLRFAAAEAGQEDEEEGRDAAAKKKNSSSSSSPLSPPKMLLLLHLRSHSHSRLLSSSESSARAGDAPRSSAGASPTLVRRRRAASPRCRKDTSTHKKELREREKVKSEFFSSFPVTLFLLSLFFFFFSSTLRVVVSLFLARERTKPNKKKHTLLPLPSTLFRCMNEKDKCFSWN